MEIGRSSDKPIPVSTTTQAAPQKEGQRVASTAVATASTSAKSNGVAVTVSTLARTLEAASSGETGEVDMGKVNSVKAAIEQGTYVVSPEVIADKLLANAQEMLNRTHN